MKKTLCALTLLLVILASLCSCAEAELQTKPIPNQNIEYDHFEVGNVLNDGELAIFFFFESDYKVSEMEIEGDLLDYNGNSIHHFEAKMELSPPTNQPSLTIFVDKNLILNIAAVSCKTIKAYTTASTSGNVDTPSAAVGPATINFGEFVAVFIIAGCVLAIITIIFIKIYYSITNRIV